MAKDAEDPEDPKDPLSRYLEAAVGLTELTRKRAERIVRNVVKKGEAAGNPKQLVEDLLERSGENREALVTLVRGETERAMRAMGLATRNDVERLEQQLRALRRQLAEAEETAGTTEAQERAKRTAAKRTAEETAAKKTPEAAAKKTSTKKASTKKAAKKTARKKTGE